MPKGVPNKRYTPEFKVLVVETIQKERSSYCETARQFEIGDDKRVASWERVYLTEGLAVERRGRSSKGQAAKLPRGLPGIPERPETLRQLSHQAAVHPHQELYRRRKETIERVFADAKEKHAMRYTQFDGRD